jgi:predicted phage terminase large subunit-like protein
MALLYVDKIREQVDTSIISKHAVESWENLATIDFSFYCEYVHRRLYFPAAHTRYMCSKLEAVERGEIKRIMFLLPPRHGKSMTVSETFPSWFLGKNPHKRVIEVSYGDKLAQRFGRLNKQKVSEFGDDLFKIKLPEWGVGTQSTTDWGLSVWDKETEKYVQSRGGMLSSGIGGSITGEGASLLIIDDPIKNREEADSQVYRDKIWGEYQNTLLTRLTPDGAIVLIVTRWHEDDIVGRILDKEKDWEVVCFPCVAELDKDILTGEYVLDPLGREEGELLWPEFGFDAKWAEATKERVGPRVWLSLFQQKPTAAMGTRYQRSWWQFYKELPVYDVKIQSWDTGLKQGAENDPSNCQTWARCKNGYYLIDRWNEKVGFPELVMQMKAKYAQHNFPEAPVNVVYVEEATSGYQAMQTIKRDTNIPVITVPTKNTSKEARADSISGLIEAGKCFLPDPYYHKLPWVSEFLDQWSSFPLAAHDEDVDVTSQALIKLKSMSGTLIHTSDEVREPQKTEVVVDASGRVVYIEKAEPEDGNDAGHNGDGNGAGKDRYSEVAVRFGYFSNKDLSSQDYLLNTCKEQQFVPMRCLRVGSEVMHCVREGNDPCTSCSATSDMRDECGGRKKQIAVNGRRR